MQESMAKQGGIAVALILIVGIAAPPEEAHQHGVMFCPSSKSTELDFFLQKPPIAEIRDLSSSHASYLDTGVWLLSKAAIDVLMRKCGWDGDNDSFTGDLPANYDLYTDFGPALGDSPTEHDDEISRLS